MMILRLLLLLVLTAPAHAGEIAFKPLQPGLGLATLNIPPPDGDPQPQLYILRIDPERFDLKLVTASARKETPATAKDWTRRVGAVAAINSNMYQTDHRTSVSLMRGPGFVNNPRLSKDNTVLMFNRSAKGLPRAQIVDRSCQPFAKLRTQYRSQVQSIRMLDCTGMNVWARQPRRYSHAVMGQDGQGHILFIFTAAAWRTHDFVNMLQRLPIRITRLMYGDGGPPAQLYVNAGGVEVDGFGVYSGRLKRHFSTAARPIPNVIAVVPRR
jgi:hypothetical protein